MLGKLEARVRILVQLSLLLVFATLRCWAQSDPPEICKQYSAVPLPPEAAVATPAEFPACNAYKSYAGIGRDADYSAARSCAWQERAANEAKLAQNPKAPIAWAVGGSLILADLYANGLGTAQNLPLAARLVCEEDGLLRSQAITDLEARKVSVEKSAKPVELCDYAATTFGMNFCAAYSSERENDQRERKITSLSSGWNEVQKAAFASAELAFNNYALSVARHETYQGGTIRNLRSNAVEQGFRQSFFLNLLKFEQGSLPTGSADGARQADMELNAVYRKAMDTARSLTPRDPEQVQPDGIRDTERLWLRYRDAWLAFAKLRYPATNSGNWLSYLSHDRTEVLKTAICSVDTRSSVCTPAILQQLDSLP